MSELLLDSLEIKGYRCFEHLTIEKLGRVNLIVGKNNVGKTALLEALWIYSNDVSGAVEEVLQARDENKKTRFYKQQSADKMYRHLFHNRIVASPEKKEIDFRVGSLDEQSNYTSFVGILKHHETAYYTGNRHSKIIPCQFLKVKRLEKVEINAFWDAIANTQIKVKVFEALKLLDDKIIEVNVQPIEFTSHNVDTIILTQRENESEALPLKSYGEGLNRLFEIALLLVNCENGILLIDEIEIGLHYSVLPDVWKLIFKTAKDLNVQVFATTHSNDCIEAFTQAAIDDEESKGMLIRLERNKDDKIIAKTIEEERLADAINYGAEVR
jgi:AAA15 family ATPase/GTPase